MSIRNIFVRVAILDNPALSKPEIIGSILALLAETGEVHVPALPEMVHTILRREHLGSTGIGRGLALPHGQHASLTHPLGLFVVLRNPRDFDSLDLEPVDLLSMLLSPTNPPGGQHAYRLRYLETISRTLREVSLCQALRQAATPEEVERLLHEAGVPFISSPVTPLDARRCQLFADACGVLPVATTPAVVLGRALAAPVPTNRQVELLHDLFGPPGRRGPVDPRWLAAQDGAARRVGEGIAATDAFIDLPILADALEDAGCTDTELLDHLRGPGPHGRGCWALDLARGLA